MQRRIIGAGVGLAMLAGAGWAQTYVVRKVDGVPAKGFAEIHLSRAALPGERVRVWWATSINPDCTPDATLTPSVVQAPRHGALDVTRDPLFPNFQPPNPRTVCNTRKVPGAQAFYTSAPDFHGHDRMVLENASSEGRIRRFVFDVDVR